MTEATVCKAVNPGLVTLLALLLSGSAAMADTVPAMAPQSQPPPAQAARQADPGWPTLQQLLELPDWMQLTLTSISEPMVGINGPSHPAGQAATMQQLVLATAFSRGLGRAEHQWQEFDHWRLNVQLASFSGDPNLNLALGSAFPLQASAHPLGLWLTEASLQRSQGRGALGLRAGLLPLNPAFLDTPAFDNYIHSALNDTFNLMIPGLPIRPFLAPGAELRWRQSAGSELRIGSYWLDNETALAAMFGVNPQQPDIRGSLQIVQWTFSDLPGSRAVAGPIATTAGPIARQLPAPVLQLGAFTTTASSTLYPAGTNQGLNASVTIPVGLPIGRDSRLWMAISNGLNSPINPYPLFVAGGWLNQGPLPGRPFDVLALALARTSYSPQLVPGSYEAVVELNYAITLNQRLSLQPVLQWIINPGGNNTGNAVFAGGLQLTLNL